MKYDGDDPMDWARTMLTSISNFNPPTTENKDDDELTTALKSIDGAVFLEPSELANLFFGEPSLNYSLQQGTPMYSEWARNKITGREGNVIYVNFKTNNEYAGF